MIRKLLVVAAAIAMPVSVVAVTAGTAGAKAPLVAPAISCHASGLVTFASPGISHLGSVSANKTSTTTTSATTFNSCTGGPNTSGGSAPGNNIVSKSAKCPKTATAGLPPGCVKPMYYYDTANSFATTGTANIQKSLKKLSITLDGIAFSAKTASASVIGCAGGESGFKLTGSVKSSPKYSYTSFTLTACLGADTGSNLHSGGTNAGADIADALGGGADVIATAAIDSGTSTLAIS